MKEQYIRFSDPHVFIAAALYLQAKLGYALDMNILSNLDSSPLLKGNELVMGLHNKTAIYQSLHWGNYNDAPLSATLLEFIELMKEPQIKVGDYIAEIKKEGVQVGCTFVPWATVEAIAALNPNK